MRHPSRPLTGVRHPLRTYVYVLLLATGAVAAGTARASGAIQQGTLITLASGQVQGHLNEDSREFLGIPYAAPPVGALRWRPPVPASPWVGVLDAASFSSPCAQLPSLTGTPSEQEDCLYLNVWSPDPAPAEPLPVMVWIHGGSNLVGSTGDFVPFPPYENVRLYDAHLLAAEQHLVVVTINYRLGVFGFFGHAALAGEDPGFPYGGNQGLLDQRAALIWVQQNIAAFGGDPGNVTIFGESAGSFDVCAHVASPLSAGLFHRAISESGGCTASVATAAAAASHANGISEALGCSGALDELACLREVAVPDLLTAAEANPEDIKITNLGIAIDGGFLPASPRSIFDAGTFARVPYLLGANADEGTLFFLEETPVTTAAEYTAALEDRFGAELAPEIEAVYPSGSAGSPQATLVRLIGDAALVCSTHDVARRVAAAGSRTYVYNFARVIPQPFVSLLKLGAFHGAEIPYVFGSVTPPTAGDERLGTRMQEYWTSFAAKGRNPRAKKSARWPRFRPKHYDILGLDGLGYPTDVRKIKNFRRAECDFWSSVYERLNP